MGCGHGHYLLSYAKSTKDEIFIGIDRIAKRIRKAQAKLDKQGLRNVFFFKAEANEVLEILAREITISKVLILFPDPWPKARHHKKRLIQTHLLSELAKRMAIDKKLYFRTDHENYFALTQEKIVAHPAWRLEEDFAWPHEASSYFQDLVNQWHSLVAVRI